MLRYAPRLSRLYLDALRAADAARAYRVAAQAREQGMTIPSLYQRVITPAMYAIGELWEKGAITVADEHLATELTQRVLTGIRPPIRIRALPDEAEGEATASRALLAAVEGEQHALGLRMVADLLEDAGYRAICLGADVPTRALLQAVDSLSPDLLALSVTTPELASTMEEVAAEARREHPRLELMVGGQAAPAGLEDLATRPRDLESLADAIAPPV